MCFWTIHIITVFRTTCKQKKQNYVEKEGESLDEKEKQMISDEEKEFFEKIYRIELRGFIKGFLVATVVMTAIFLLVTLVH